MFLSEYGEQYNVQRVHLMLCIVVLRQMIKHKENRINYEVKLQVPQLIVKHHWVLVPVKGIREPSGRQGKKSFNIGGIQTHDLWTRSTVD